MQIRWKSQVSFPLCLGSWPSLIRRIRDDPRADSLEISCFLPSLLGKMAVFEKTDSLDRDRRVWGGSCKMFHSTYISLEKQRWQHIWILFWVCNCVMVPYYHAGGEEKGRGKERKKKRKRCTRMSQSGRLCLKPWPTAWTRRSFALCRCRYRYKYVLPKDLDRSFCPSEGPWQIFPTDKESLIE